MKSLINQNRVVTKSVYLAAAMLAVVIGICVASTTASIPEVNALNNITSDPFEKPVNVTQEIESVHDMLQRIAKANAADSLGNTRKTVLEELQSNVTNPLNSDEFIIEPVEGVDSDNLQLLAEHDAARSLEATRKIVLEELRDNMQLVADNDAAQLLKATRQMVLEELENNVIRQFYADLQYGQPVDVPEQNDQQVASAVFTDQLHSYRWTTNNKKEQQ